MICTANVRAASWKRSEYEFVSRRKVCVRGLTGKWSTLEKEKKTCWSGILFGFFIWSISYRLTLLKRWTSPEELEKSNAVQFVWTVRCVTWKYIFRYLRYDFYLYLVVSHSWFATILSFLLSPIPQIELKIYKNFGVKTTIFIFKKKTVCLLIQLWF